jgi:hypothetical protein
LWSTGQSSTLAREPGGGQWEGRKFRDLRPRLALEFPLELLGRGRVAGGDIHRPPKRIHVDRVVVAVRDRG